MQKLRSGGGLRRRGTRRSARTSGRVMARSSDADASGLSRAEALVGREGYMQVQGGERE